MPLTLNELAQRRAEATFAYYGETVRVLYLPEVLTKQFRAQSLLMQREGNRIQRRTEEAVTRIRTIVAEDGTPEAAAEDQAALDALVQLERDDAALKLRIDEMVRSIVSEWDLEQDDGSQLPVTEETVAALPPDFERAVLEAIMETADVGEAKKRQSVRPSPLTLRQKAKLVTSHPRRIG